MSQERISVKSINKIRARGRNLPSTCFFSFSRSARTASSSYCSCRTEASFSSPAILRSSKATLS
jgi:hypothetical protein